MLEYCMELKIQKNLQCAHKFLWTTSLMYITMHKNTSKIQCHAFCKFDYERFCCFVTIGVTSLIKQNHATLQMNLNHATEFKASNKDSIMASVISQTSPVWLFTISFDSFCLCTMVFWLTNAIQAWCYDPYSSFITSYISHRFVGQCTSVKCASAIISDVVWTPGDKYAVVRSASIHCLNSYLQPNMCMHKLVWIWWVTKDTACMHLLPQVMECVAVMGVIVMKASLGTFVNAGQLGSVEII